MIASFYKKKLMKKRKSATVYFFLGTKEIISKIKVDDVIYLKVHGNSSVPIQFWP